MLLDVVLHDCLVFHIQLSVEVCSVYMVGRLWIFCVHVWGISGVYILHVSKAWYMQIEYFHVRMVEPPKDIGWEH